MEHNNKENKILSSLMGSIREGKVDMKPRWRFVFNTGLGIAGVVILSLTLLYVSSLIVFSMHSSGVMHAPGFGSRGIITFMLSLPWLLIIFAGTLLIFLELLVKKYTFSYRKPLMYSLIGIILLAGFGSVIMSFYDFHGRMFRFADERDVPFMRPMYRDISRPGRGHVHVGVVSSSTSQGLVITTRRGENIDVFIDENTELSEGSSFLVGETVVVLGQKSDRGIQAIGLKKIDDIPSHLPYNGLQKNRRSFLL